MGLEGLGHPGERFRIALGFDNAGILVLNLCSSFFYLLCQHVDAHEQVERFEARYDLGNAVIG